jgi:uncharacterized delta-60 repeat protein
MGAHDGTFATAGIASYSAYYVAPTGLVVDSKGRPLVAAFDLLSGGVTTIRFTTGGDRDATWGTNGVRTTTANGGPHAVTLAALPDGGLLVVGIGSPSTVVIRYLENGTLDSNFGTAGIATLMLDLPPQRIVPLPDGSALLVGATGNGVQAPEGVLLARLTAAGKLDDTFGTGGIVKTPTGVFLDGVQVAVRGDKIFVATTASDDGLHAQLLLLRYTMSGVLDTTFGSGGQQRLSVGAGNDLLNAMAIDGNGLPLLAGRTWSPTTGTDALLVRLK